MVPNTSQSSIWQFLPVYLFQACWSSIHEANSFCWLKHIILKISTLAHKHLALQFPLTCTFKNEGRVLKLRLISLVWPHQLLLLAVKQPLSMQPLPSSARKTPSTVHYPEDKQDHTKWFSKQVTQIKLDVPLSATCCTDLLNKLFHSLHPFPPSLHQLRLQILQSLPPHRCRIMLPQHMTEIQKLNQSPFSPSFHKMMSDLTEKYPFFSTVLTCAVPRTGQCHFKSREAGLCSHLSQHTCARNCSHPLPSQCTTFPLCMAVSQCAACTTGAQKDSFIFHIFMPCHSNHGRQELRRNGKR